MTDSSTWVAAQKELSNLKILFRGDPMLINTYHALCQPPGATAAQPLAAAFIDFAVSDPGQEIVGMYGTRIFRGGIVQRCSLRPTVCSLDRAHPPHTLMGTGGRGWQRAPLRFSR